MSDRYEEGQESVLHSGRIERNVILERGLGSTVWDSEGNAYLDLLSANMGPTMVGYGHPRVAAAVRHQLETLSATRIVFDNRAQIDYCRELSSLALITEFAGKGQNVFKFKPPLTVSDSELEQMLEKSERIIRYVDERIGVDEPRAAKAG